MLAPATSLVVLLAGVVDAAVLLAAGVLAAGVLDVLADTGEVELLPVEAAEPPPIKLENKLAKGLLAALSDAGTAVLLPVEAAELPPIKLAKGLLAVLLSDAEVEAVLSLDVMELLAAAADCCCSQASWRKDCCRCSRSLSRSGTRRSCRRRRTDYCRR